VRAIDEWQPTKFATRGGRLVASRDPAQLNPGSVLSVDRAAVGYEAALRAHARGRLVDLGCGAVPLFGTYRDVVDSVTTVDWPAGAHERRHVDLMMDLNEPLELASGSFDTVLLSDVLEHIFQPQALVHEIARILAPGGKVIVGVPFYYWIHEAPHDYFRYTRFALQRLADTAGLDVVEIEETGGQVDVITDLVVRLPKRWPRVQRALVRLVTPALGSGRADRNRSRTKRRFPLGYTAVFSKPSAS
jgi:SAM-dependent methyltransferase